MFRRFVSGSGIASVGIALGALVIFLTEGLTVQRFYPLTLVWCFLPAVWGLWAMLAPAAWVPERLPLWGAILGLMAGVMAAFVLNMPFRLFGATVAVIFRGVGVVVLVVFYYFLWMLVRLAYRFLGVPASAA